MSQRVVPPGFRPRRHALVALLALAPWLWGTSGGAAGRPAVFPPGIPKAHQAQIQGIADAADVSTQVAAAEPILTRREIFEYLLDHPDFATHVTRALRLARLRIWSAPEGMLLEDGWGVRGQFWLVYAANGTRVFHAKGEYRKALLPAIQGEAVTMIEYVMAPAAHGRILVTPAVSGFVRLDNRVAAFAIRVSSGIAQRKADLEARRLMKVMTKVSRALEEDPAAVLAALNQRPDVPRRELEEFGRLLTGR